MNSYKLIILDFDGTLCATHEAILFCLKKAYKLSNYAIPSHDFIDKTIRAGIGMEKTLKTLNPTLSSIKIQKLLKNYEIIYLKEGEAKSALYPKTKETLHKLYTMGFILTVVSNKAIASVETALDNFSIKPYISMVIGDTKTLRKKPDPMAYTDFIKIKFSLINSNEILMIGDTPTDILFAKNIGADSCWAKYGYGDVNICRKLNPTYTITQIIDILKIVS